MTDSNTDLEQRPTRGSCPVHGLAVDDQGQCVLCRRAERPEKTGLPLLPVMGVLAAGLLVALGVYGVWKYGGSDAKKSVAVADSTPAAGSVGETRSMRSRGRRRRSGSRPMWMSDPPGTKQGAGGAAPEETESDAEDTTAPTATRDLEVERREAIDRAVEREEAIREEMRKVHVKVYMTTWCPVCTRTRRWLTAKGYRFTEYDIERSPDAHRKQLRLNPKGGVPTIDIEGVVLTGFSAQAIEGALRSSAERKVRM